jgi:hypothetical protein
MREIRQSGSEGGGTKPIASPYPYLNDAPSALLGTNGMTWTRSVKYVNPMHSDFKLLVSQLI